MIEPELTFSERRECLTGCRTLNESALSSNLPQAIIRSRPLKSMSPEPFIANWKANALPKRAGAKPWFTDLCEWLGVDKPSDSDNYCFERGAKKTGEGGADRVSYWFEKARAHVAAGAGHSQPVVVIHPLNQARTDQTVGRKKP
jgi:hypothetical protein